MRQAFALATFAALVLLAGCSSSPSPTTSSSSTSASVPAPDSSSYTITLEGFPTAPVQPGANITFQDVVHGAATRYSDHIGAHFGKNSTLQPSTTAYNITCVHTTGDLPGIFGVTCHAPMTPGVYYLRGHARITKPDGTQVSWWSDERAFTVAPNT
jgi:hypothetical protein